MNPILYLRSVLYHRLKVLEANYPSICASGRAEVRSEFYSTGIRLFSHGALPRHNFNRPEIGQNARLVSETRLLLPSRTTLSPLLKYSKMAQVIVVGGGLAGLSAAHTVLERGGSVLLLDKQGSVVIIP